MNASLKMTGVAIAACAVCCAVGVIPVLMASTSAVLAGAAAYQWGAAALVIAAPLVGVTVLAGRRTRQKVGPSSNRLPFAEGCGCGSCGVVETPRIACSLDSDEFATRAELIASLTARHLQNTDRSALQLFLVYAPEALGEVRELVRMEQACCAFLSFELTQDASAVILKITAPTVAAADDLFRHFAPHALTMETSA